MDTETDAEDTGLPPWGDLALSAGLLVVAILSGLYVADGRPDTVPPTSWWHWVLIGIPAVLVAFRRRDPRLVVVVATAAQVAIWVSDLPEVFLPMIVLLYTAASDGGAAGRRIAIAASAVLTVVTAIGVRTAGDVTVSQLPLIALTCGTAIVLGLHAARQRAQASELAAAVVEARLRSEHERGRAIAEERSHIGRELHDIIGHSLSVIAVRAEAADRVGDKQPGVLRDAVSDIAVAARAALTETRRVLAGLQRSSTAELAPPPDLDATVRLVDDLADRGVAVTLDREGCDEHPPPAVVAGGAFRIVQESLTNAVKHGRPGSTIETEIRCRASSLDLRITNTIAERTAGAPKTGAPATAGTGLAGMRERAEVLGGSFSAERGPDRSFVVRASLPTAAAATTERQEAGSR